MLPADQRMSSKIILRPAESSDEEFFSQLYIDSRRKEFAVLGWDETQLKPFLQMQYDFQKASYAMQFPNAKISVIEADGQSAGRIITWDGPEEMRLVDIVLLPEMQGRGIGKEVLQGLQKTTSDKPLTLQVLKTNLPALTLYQKFGFKVVDETDLSYDMEWGDEASWKQ